MKKVTFLSIAVAAALLIATFSISLLISTPAKAETKDILLGGGIGYATDIETVGIFAKGVYKIDKNWQIAPHLVYYFEKNNVTWIDIFVNANYNFYSVTNVDFYATGGLAHCRYSVSIPGYGSSSDSRTHLNLGAGLDFSIKSNINLNFEAKYMFGDADWRGMSCTIEVTEEEFNESFEKHKQKQQVKNRD